MDTGSGKTNMYTLPQSSSFPENVSDSVKELLYGLGPSSSVSRQKRYCEYSLTSLTGRWEPPLACLVPLPHGGTRGTAVQGSFHPASVISKQTGSRGCCSGRNYPRPFQVGQGLRFPRGRTNGARLFWTTVRDDARYMSLSQKVPKENRLPASGPCWAADLSRRKRLQGYACSLWLF